MSAFSIIHFSMLSKIELRLNDSEYSASMKPSNIMEFDENAFIRGFKGSELANKKLKSNSITRLS